MESECFFKLSLWKRSYGNKLNKKGIAGALGSRKKNDSINVFMHVNIPFVRMKIQRNLKRTCIKL